MKEKSSETMIRRRGILKIKRLLTINGFVEP
jgi:hypothetical protein